MIAQIILLFLNTYIQQDSISCEEKYQYFNDIRNDELIWLWDKPPELIDDKDSIYQILQYPYQAIKDHIEGTVYVSMIVDSIGRPKCIKVVRGIRDDVDNEAKRIVSKLKFSPALIKDKPVISFYTLPIEFKLPQEE